MAKRRGRRSSAFDKFAEDLGHVLGNARNKAEGWLGQRQDIAKQLAQIRDSATELLAKLTGGSAHTAVAVRRGRRGRPAGSAKPRGRAKGRTVSAAARRKMSIAAKKRWAERKAAQKKAEK